LWGGGGGGKSNFLGIPLLPAPFPRFPALFESGKLKEKEKLAKLLLFHADSQTLVKVYNQHKTVVNYYFLSLQGAQASSQQCKQTNTLHCWLAQRMTYLVCELLSYGHHDIA